MLSYFNLVTKFYAGTRRFKNSHVACIMIPEGEISFSQIHPKDMTKEAWLEDLKSFFDMMDKNNPYQFLKERERGYHWPDLLEQYQERMKRSQSLHDYLAVLYDAVQALQTGHSVIMGPNLWDLLYEVEWYRTSEPYCKIFSEEVNEYYEYWKPLLLEYTKERLQYEFEVLIMYDKGEYRIVDGHGEWKEKYGENTIITAINGRPIMDAVQEAYEKGLLDYDFRREWWFLWKIAPRHFGVDAEFTIKTSTGEEKEVKFQSGYDFPHPNPLRFPEDRLYTRIWHDRKTGYVRIGDFSENMIENDHDVLLEFYKKIESFDLLIIDIRGNGGGTYLPWKMNVIAPLVKETLQSRMYLAYRKAPYVNMFRENSLIGETVQLESLDNPPPELKNGDYFIHEYPHIVESSGECSFNGKIVVLIDAFTYSATDAFAIFCKETGFAKLYGTATGGDGISYSPIYYILPNSKLVVRFTPAMGLDYTGSANEEVRVQPDVYYESTHGDWDSLIEYVMKEEL